MGTRGPTCGWLDAHGQECESTPNDTIILRDTLVAGTVLVCRKHKAEHNRMAGALRVTRRDNGNKVTTKHDTTPIERV